MELKTCPTLSGFLLAILLLASFHYQVSAVSTDTLSGGWQPIKDLTSPIVLEIARFAVSEHNKAGGKLQFVKVFWGATKVTEGTRYHLFLTATDGAAGNRSGSYVANVWDKPWEHFRKLTFFFKLAGDV